jgi:hypothetical protein
LTTEIKSELLLASINAKTQDILYTWVLTYPRVILAEVNTHRMASKNTSSSRAIPSSKQRRKVVQDPFIPLHIGTNRKGMQAGEELAGWKRSAAEMIWRGSRYPQVWASWAMEKLGVHKQIVNRLVEPYTWTQQLFSATEVDNFFWLRDHPDAEPHFQELAGQMRKQVEYVRAYSKRVYIDLQCAYPIQWLQPGEWHLPFVDAKEREVLGLDYAKKTSSARCARVSYVLPETGSKSTLQRDLELFERLAIREEYSDDPRHLSPLEHPAQAMEQSVYCGNFRGFKQFRKEIPHESGPTNRAA